MDGLKKKKQRKNDQKKSIITKTKASHMYWTLVFPMKNSSRVKMDNPIEKCEIHMDLTLPAGHSALQEMDVSAKQGGTVPGSKPPHS